MTSAWGWSEECPLFSLYILTHQCHGFPCMRIQFSNSGAVLIFMKDTSALSKSNLFRLDDCKAHLHLHCFISLLSLIWYYLSQTFYNLIELYLKWFFQYIYWCILGVCVYICGIWGYICVYLGVCLWQYMVEVNIWHWDVFLNQVKFIVIIISNWF